MIKKIKNGTTSFFKHSPSHLITSSLPIITTKKLLTITINGDNDNEIIFKQL